MIVAAAWSLSAALLAEPPELPSPEPPRPATWELEWSAPGACPDEAAIREQVAALVPSHSGGEGVLHVVGRVEAREGGHVLTLRTAFFDRRDEATGRNMQTIYTRLRRLEGELQAQLGELERVRRARPRATAQSWALLLPALKGGVLLTAGGVAATATTWGWVAAHGDDDGAVSMSASSSIGERRARGATGTSRSRIKPTSRSGPPASISHQFPVTRLFSARRRPV